MTQALREPVNIVSRYLRSSPVRSGRLGRHHGTLTPLHLAKFHDNSATREEQEDSDSDLEVFGPFPATRTLDIKGNTKTTEVGGTSVHVVKDSEHGPGFKPLHPLFFQNTIEETTIPAPRVKKPTGSRKIVSAASSSASSRASSSTSLLKQTARSASKLAKSVSTSTSTISIASMELEPPAELPLYSYTDFPDPKAYVVYTRDVDEADDLIAGLKPGPVAFDMEWCFSTTRLWGAKTKERRTAVVQVADSAGLVIIVHLAGMPRFPKALQMLLENPKIPKLGANILNDGKKLFRDYGVLAKNLLELGALAAAWDPAHNIKRKIISLAKLTVTYCGKTLVKGDERISNWEVSELSELQKDYAANDVHCSMEIYKRLRSLTADMTLDPPAGTDVEWYLLKDAQDGQGTGAEMRFQWRRAHKLWHEKGMPLETMCIEMRVRKEGVPDEGPLKSATVISYVIYALQADPKLPFDIEKLRRLVQMDATSWARHRTWLIEAWFKGIEMQQRPADIQDSTTGSISANADEDMASINEGSS
ncbi:hypothetical protein H2248_012231 [Termitomyces sp. 'cryptogamus']|nr:hypothetical protein H2248_012231 [Termitomyces sp. 'cryptogamus']